MNYIQEYQEKIITGQIAVSKKVRRTYEIITERLNTPGKFHFDIDRANQPIKFIEKYCKHSEGSWKGKNIELELFQKAMIQAMFGFIDDKGFRQCRETFIVLGRKNGKSTMMSGLGLYMMMGDREGGAQIACVASKKDQARLVFNPSKNMVNQSPTLKKYIKMRKSDMYMEKTFSTFAPLASDSNTLDGLNLHAGIIDELHSILDRNIYDVTLQSMSSRDQPMLFMITTSGFHRETIYDSSYDYAKNWLDGTIIDERYLAFIYELDDYSEWTEPETWVKANPGLGTIKQYDTLVSLVEKAKVDSKIKPSVLTKEFNLPQTSYKAWLDYDTFFNEEKYDLKDFKDCYAVGGADLSSVGDLTCATLMIRKNKKFNVIQMYFIPRELAEKKEHEDRVPYSLWEKQGWITFSDANKVDYRDVTAWYLKMRQEHGVYPLWIGYDNWNAQYWTQEMISNGFVLEAVRQGAQTMSGPMKTMEADFKDKLIVYNNNPILKWCLSNTQIETDKNDNIRPIKGKNAKMRIDGTVSLIDAYVVYQNHLQDYLNLTE